MTREPREADPYEYRVERGDTIMRRRKASPGEWSGPWERVAVEATDPLLREALERIAGKLPLAGPLTGREAQRTAREALAAAPEPEWEYRVVCGNLESGPCGLGTARIYADIDGHIERRRVPGEWEALPDDSERTP